MSWRLERLYTRRFLFGAVTGFGFLLVTYSGPPFLNWAFPPTIVIAVKSDQPGITVVSKQLGRDADKTDWVDVGYYDLYDPSSSFKDRWPGSSTGRKPLGTKLAAKPVDDTGSDDLMGVWGDYFPATPDKRSNVPGTVKTAERDGSYSYDYYVRDAPKKRGGYDVYDYSVPDRAPDKRSHISRPVKTASREGFTYADTGYSKPETSGRTYDTGYYDTSWDTGSYDISPKAKGSRGSKSKRSGYDFTNSIVVSVRYDSGWGSGSSDISPRKL